MKANDLESYLLEGKLLASTIDKSERFGMGIVQGAQLNFDRLGSQFGKTLLKFSVKDEGDVGIQLLLELEELQLLPCPRTSFVHGEHNLIGASVVCQRIENTRMFQTVQL